MAAEMGRPGMSVKALTYRSSDIVAGYRFAHAGNQL
jgi:hypothetical protein